MCCPYSQPWRAAPPRSPPTCERHRTQRSRSSKSITPIATARSTLTRSTLYIAYDGKVTGDIQTGHLRFDVNRNWLGHPHVSETDATTVGVLLRALRRLMSEVERDHATGVDDIGRLNRPRCTPRAGQLLACGHQRGVVADARPGDRREVARSRLMRPSSRTSTRSASDSASSTSWVTSRTAGRCRRQRSVSSACIRMRVRASSAPNGSSSSSSAGGGPAPARAPPAAPPRRTASGARPLAWSVSPTSARAACARGRVGQPERHVLAAPAPTAAGGRPGRPPRPPAGPPRDRRVRGRGRRAPAAASVLPDPLRPRSATNSPRPDRQVDAVEHVPPGERAPHPGHGHRGLGESGRHRTSSCGCQRSARRSTSRTSASESSPRVP